MIDCIEATSIPVCMIGLLTALPGTQLTRRLQKEGRLLPFQNMDGGDQCTSGLNFVPLRPRRDILEDYKAVLTAVYAPAAYFERVRTVGRELRRPSYRVKLLPATYRTGPQHASAGHVADDDPEILTFEGTSGEHSSTLPGIIRPRCRWS